MALFRTGFGRKKFKNFDEWFQVFTGTG